jgi:peptidyl-dipeptidase A
MLLVKKFVCAFVCVCCILLGSTASVHAQDNGVESLLDSLSLKFDWIQYRIATERWQLLTGHRPDSLLFFEDLARYTFSDPGVYKQLQSANAAGLSAEGRRKLTYFLHLFQVNKVETSAGLRSIRDSILFGLGEMKFVFDGVPVDSGELGRMVRSSSDRTVRERAYRALYVGDEKRADQMTALMRLRNQEAKKEGYNTFAALAFSHDAVMLDDYGRILSEVETQTQAAYDDLQARLRTQMGGGQLEAWDLSVLAGSGMRRHDNLFIVDTLFSSLLAGLNATGFDFDNLPIYYEWTDSTLPYPITAIPVRSPRDQRLTGYLRPGLEHLRRLFGQTGLTVYSAYVRQDDPLFNRPLEGPMRYAVEYLFELIPDKSNWLQKVFGMPGAQADDIDRSARDLHLLAIRLLLAEASFELEVYRNPTAKLNDLYWNTFERVMGVPKHVDLFPASTDPQLVLLPFSSGEKLLGWLIAAQTWDYLKDFSGSVVSSRDTRAFLVQNYFRFGSRFDWPELLERGTGSSLDASHLKVFIAQ